jgi:hypothetical protein
MSMTTWTARLNPKITPLCAWIDDPNDTEMGRVWACDTSMQPPGIDRILVACVCDYLANPRKTSTSMTYHLDRVGTPFLLRWVNHPGHYMIQEVGGHGKYAGWLNLALEAGLELPGMAQTVERDP